MVHVFTAPHGSHYLYTINSVTTNDSHIPLLVQAVELIDRSEAESQLGLMPHEVKFSCIINPDVRSTEPHQLPDKLHNVVEK